MSYRVSRVIRVIGVDLGCSELRQIRYKQCPYGVIRVIRANRAIKSGRTFSNRVIRVIGEVVRRVGRVIVEVSGVIGHCRQRVHRDIHL